MYLTDNAFEWADVGLGYSDGGTVSHLTNSQNCLVNDLRPRGRARCRSQRIYWPDNEKGLLIVQKTLIKTRCYFYQDAMLFLLK